MQGWAGYRGDYTNTTKLQDYTNTTKFTLHLSATDYVCSGMTCDMNITKHDKLSEVNVL